MRDKWLLLLALLFLGGGGYAAYTMTRGLRLNNPGNIRRSPELWAGLSTEQPDEEFFSFISPEYGLRAMAKLLMNYQNKYGLRTVQSIVSRWAPPSENNTDAYTDNVSDEMRVFPDTVLSLSHLPALMAAMIKQEQGIQPYSHEQIMRGIQMAT